MNYTQEEIADMVLDMQRWLEAKRGRRTMTEQEFLDRKRTCDKCARQSICRKVHIGYVEEYGLGGEYYGRHNRMTNHIDSVKCCVWDGETTNSIMDALEVAKKEGRVVG